MAYKAKFSLIEKKTYSTGIFFQDSNNGNYPPPSESNYIIGDDESYLTGDDGSYLIDNE